jgi:23S rRNA pseudouridine1911/1915/1917 synthase
LNIIYEDNHLFVVNKQAGVLTEPSGTDQPNLEDQAKAYIKRVYEKPGNVFLTAAHRIDKPASGIIVFAKTSKCLSRIHQSIRERKVKKKYRALVQNAPKNDEALLEHYLVHDDFHARVVPSYFPQAKLARLTYQIAGKKGDYTILDIDLETGRYHQIRAQLEAIGCPIIGDTRYGSPLPFKSEAIALHHTQLEIPHPISGEWILFNSPADF